MKEIGKKELEEYINCEYFRSKYIFHRFIGKGGFGFVVEGKLKVDDRESIAIKIVRKWTGYESYIANEINIHSKLDHENIVDLRGVPFG
jgi:serine/threonine protein kinase